MNRLQIALSTSLFLNVLLIAGVAWLIFGAKTIKEEPLPYIPPAENLTLTEDLEPPIVAPTTTPEAATIPTTTEIVEEEAYNSPTLFTLFSDLLSSITFPNTQLQDEIISITGDRDADDVIFALAEDAGYVRQSVATGTLSVVEGYRVQPEVVSAWIGLREAAREDGIELAIVSGYRSLEAQRSLFLKYFQDESRKDGVNSYSAEEIKRGDADKAILRTITYAAPPGYSRHHNGYTLDIRDVGSGLTFYQFARTNGYRWISRFNYEKAREFGFIPSYPRGERENGGPEPEPWEFVYVGIPKIEKLDWTRLE